MRTSRFSLLSRGRPPGAKRCIVQALCDRINIGVPEKLDKLGVRFSINDFDTRHSYSPHLKKAPAG